VEERAVYGGGDRNRELRLRQAIKYFEDAIKDTDEIIDECSDVLNLKVELLEQKKYFIMALEALRKEAEAWVN